MSKTFLLSTSMLGVTIMTGAAAMMPSAKADGTITPIDDTITITVDSACTMGQTVLQSSNTLNPGETNTIGSSRIAAYCNDAEGYAIYAIGYTNGEYGNTGLVSTSSSSHIIPTGTSGTDSYWNMKLTGGTATGSVNYQPTMVNTFTDNTNIPNDYTKVAYRDSSTIPQTEDPTETGSYFTTAYQAHLSATQSAGVYNGQVQYVMVHPSGAAAPAVPFMQTVSQWKDTLLPNIGDSIRAIDRRDGKKYWVTKLADGNIWMTQNLDFDIVAGKTYTSYDTDLQYSTIGTSWTPSASTGNASAWTHSSIYPASYDPGNRYWNGELTSNEWAAIESMTVTSESASPGGSHYHIGNYYNWTAALALNDSSPYTEPYPEINQSICPAGWMLPPHKGDKSYENLISAQKITAGISGNIQNPPVFFVYGGFWVGWLGSFGENGYYWSSTRYTSDPFSYNLFFDYDGSLHFSNVYHGDGHSVRCVAR